MVVRAKAVKDELSDVEGLGFKLEERQQDILELKRTFRLKVSIADQCSLTKRAGGLPNSFKFLGSPCICSLPMYADTLLKIGRYYSTTMLNYCDMLVK